MRPKRGFPGSLPEIRGSRIAAWPAIGLRRLARSPPGVASDRSDPTGRKIRIALRRGQRNSRQKFGDATLGHHHGGIVIRTIRVSAGLADTLSPRHTSRDKASGGLRSSAGRWFDAPPSAPQGPGLIPARSPAPLLRTGPFSLPFLHPTRPAVSFHRQFEPRPADRPPPPGLSGSGRHRHNVRVVTNPGKHTVSVHILVPVRIKPLPKRPKPRAVGLDAGMTEVFANS